MFQHVSRMSRNLASVVVVIGCATTASAKTTAVGTCRPDLASFDSFSDAIPGTPAGSTILVCPGTYAEQIVITKDLTIAGTQSANSGLPVIVPPPGGLLQNAVSYNVSSGFLQNSGLAAQILVNPGVTVTIRNLALDASNNNISACSTVPVGIYFADSSGSVTHVAFKNQSAPCFFDGFAGLLNYPQGDGIFVQSDGSLPAVVSVLNSSFHNPGWMAIHADGAGANVTIKNNTAVGPGVTYGNGILVEYGAGAAAVANNSESNALVNGQSTGYWGILLNYCAGNSLITANTLSNTQIGIYATCNTNTITYNWIFNSQIDGIDVCGSGNTVQNNTINDSSRAGVNLVQGCAAQSNLVSSNTIDGACSAVLSGTDAAGNTVGPNTLFNTKFLQLTGSSCN
jgi:parallel beta-helix repeat protein